MKKVITVIATIALLIAIAFTSASCSMTPAAQEEPTTTVSSVQQFTLFDGNNTGDYITADTEGFRLATDAELQEEITKYQSEKANMDFRQKFENAWNLAVSIRANADALENEREGKIWVVKYALNFNECNTYFVESKDNGEHYNVLDDVGMFHVKAEYSESGRDMIVWNTNIGTNQTSSEVVSNTMFLVSMTEALMDNDEDSLEEWVVVALDINNNLKTAVEQELKTILRDGYDWADTKIDGYNFHHYITLKKTGEYNGATFMMMEGDE